MIPIFFSFNIVVHTFWKFRQNANVAWLVSLVLRAITVLIFTKSISSSKLAIV